MFFKKDKSKLSSISLLLIGGLVIGIYGILCVYWGYESKSWPTTDGVVILSRISGSTRVIGRKASIKFEYYVDGKRHVSPLVSYTWKCVDYAASIEILRKYPEGKEIIVYYDPDDPDRAVLNTEISLRILWIFSLSILTLLIGMKGLKWKQVRAEEKT
ncbi:MAG: hypothetical protein B6I36_09370 [Desulfobacteraceae bacterium 4572_35.1]|nr:MAG: hypothetical protein B6I36_09370 [Desulfobacteraceae bacterium 4572_35.1]